MMSIYVLLVFLILLFWGKLFFDSTIKKVFYPDYNSSSDILARSLEYGDFDKSFLELRKNNFQIKSKYGYDLSGFTIDGDCLDKCIIFVHGIKWNRYAMVKYWHYFKKAGYNAVFYDQRSHGESGGDFPTYGYYEKHDLKSIEQYTRKIYPKTKILGVFGESLGGATVLQYLPLAENVSFAVADCSYSDLQKELIHQISLKKMPDFFKKYCVKKTVDYINNQSDLIIENISPEKSIMKSSIPILLVHGKDDIYVPTRFSIEMYNQRKNQFKTDLLLVEKAEHAESIRVDREKYEEKLTTFLNEVLL